MERVDWKKLIAKLCIGLFIFIFVECYMKIDVPLWLWCSLAVGIGWV